MLRHFVQYYSFVLRTGRSRRGMLNGVLCSRKLAIVLLTGIATLCFGEYLIYYLVLGAYCSWPDLSKSAAAVNALILADPHLLGIRQGHWFDKLRREWQMERTFQTSLTLFNPDVVFVLGDLFDEGEWASREEIEIYAGRFSNVFNTHGRPLYAAVGNHDVGFHFAITEKKLRWFYDAFHLDSVRVVTIRGVVFVLLNSMAFEGDHCRLCTEAERLLADVNRTLNCVKQRSSSSSDCAGHRHFDLATYSRPVLMQHFPLYRFSEARCNEPDAAPVEEKTKPFRQRWECLSEEATDLVLEKLHPRVAFDGHSHYGCLTNHASAGSRIPEYTVGSFSCRNTKNPGFILATFTPSDFAISKCPGVRETTVYGIYLTIFVALPSSALIYCFYRRCSGTFNRKHV